MEKFKIGDLVRVANPTKGYEEYKDKVAKIIKINNEGREGKFYTIDTPKIGSSPNNFYEEELELEILENKFTTMDLESKKAFVKKITVGLYMNAGLFYKIEQLLENINTIKKEN